MKVNHPFPGPQFTEYVSGRLAAGASGAPTRGPDSVCLFAWISANGADSANAIWAVAGSTDSTGFGVPLFGNIPVYFPIVNMQQLYFAGSGTVSFGLFR